MEANERQIEKFVSQVSNEANRMVREYNKRLKKGEEGNTSSKDSENDFKVPKEKDLKLLQEHADLKLVKFDPDGNNFNFVLLRRSKNIKEPPSFSTSSESL